MAIDRVDHEDIYAHRAEAYDALVGAEDYEGNLLPAIESVAPLEGAVVLEVGAGTGRITRRLVERARSVTATDKSPAMLAVARRHLERRATGGVRQVAAANWELIEADACALPVGDAWADVAIAGWVLGHFTAWSGSRFREVASLAIGEMTRALRPGGTLVIVETLGTGATEPAPPNAALAEYYAWLEADLGFARRAIRTDYRFESVERAVELMTFFFGGERAERVRVTRSAIVPECTGVWSRRRTGAETTGAAR